MKILHVIIILLLLPPIICRAQDDNDISSTDFSVHTIEKQRRPLPYPYLRETDIVWRTILWKTIDLHEAYNQFFYFPIEIPPEKRV